MLAALPDHVVLSEAGRSTPCCSYRSAIPPSRTKSGIMLLRAMLSALGQPLGPAAAGAVRQARCLASLHRPSSAGRSPTCRWVFLYRDPVEVLSRTGGWWPDTLPGVLQPPQLLRPAPQRSGRPGPGRLRRDVLAEICAAACCATATRPGPPTSTTWTCRRPPGPPWPPTLASR